MHSSPCRSGSSVAGVRGGEVDTKPEAIRAGRTSQATNGNSHSALSIPASPANDALPMAAGPDKAPMRIQGPSSLAVSAHDESTLAMNGFRTTTPA